MQWRCVCINSNNQEKAHLPWGAIFMIRRNSLVSDTGHSGRGGRRTLSGGVPRCMSQWTRSSRPACETKYMLACSTIRTEIQHDVCHGTVVDLLITLPQAWQFSSLCRSHCRRWGQHRMSFHGHLSNAFWGHLDWGTDHGALTKRRSSLRYAAKRCY